MTKLWDYIAIALISFFLGFYIGISPMLPLDW